MASTSAKGNIASWIVVVSLAALVSCSGDGGDPTSEADTISTDATAATSGDAVTESTPAPTDPPSPATTPATSADTSSTAAPPPTTSPATTVAAPTTAPATNPATTVPPPPPTTEACRVVGLNETARSGDCGDTVVFIQERLTVLGFPVDADGHFGPLTESAVKDFQTSRGLDADGLVGPNTWAALVEGGIGD